ncbi:MAG: hypothetical protein CYG60_18235 [Actinobacteria bacterium]|nr:MAG: hypothetical protein CYG60_18235 [Actinomycetota bacterium]
MQSYHQRACLSIVFDVRHAEQAEALHYWRSAFGPASDIEAVTEDVYVLHLYPGGWCWQGPEEAA